MTIHYPARVDADKGGIFGVCGYFGYDPAAFCSTDGRHTERVTCPKCLLGIGMKEYYYILHDGTTGTVYASKHDQRGSEIVFLRGKTPVYRIPADWVDKIE